MKLVNRIFKREDIVVTSPFGYRTHPITGAWTMHDGTDYGTFGSKLPQYAIEDGYVQLVNENANAGYGKYVWVRYPRLNISLFHAHLSSICVKKGDIVNENTLIGYTGTTGNSTGIHLHLGMTLIGSDEWLNPDTYDYKPILKTYEVLCDIPVYISSIDALNKTNVKTTFPKGMYLIYQEANGMINITQDENVPWGWINPSENIETVKEPIPSPAPEQTEEKKPEEVEKKPVPEQTKEEKQEESINTPTQAEKTTNCFISLLKYILNLINKIIKR